MLTSLNQGQTTFLSSRKRSEKTWSHPDFVVSLLEFFDDGRNHLEEVAHDAVVGDLEDRRFLVLVDRDDDAAVVHAREVLNRARDADGYIEIGRHDLAGLADLPVVRHEARVDRRARGAHGR